MGITKAQIKQISALNRRKTREEFGLFVAEGEKVVEELLASTIPLVQLYVTEEGMQKRHEWQSMAEIVSGNDMERITQLSSPSPFLALARIPTLTKTSWQKRILFLDRIQDPGNMGALLRIADWFHWDLVAAPGSVDFWNPKVVMSSMGSIFRVAPIEMDAIQLKSLLGENYLWVGTDMRGTELNNWIAPEQLVLVLGSEAQGMSDELEQMCSTIITIPGGGKTESLNVSVAAGIVTYAITSQK
jgi:TrmH family RNA methyltransferase